MAEEINLNHLTAYEYGKHRSNSEGSNWEHYKDLVTRLFFVKDFYFFESELLQDYKAETMDELLATYPDKFFPAGSKNKHLKDFDTQNFRHVNNELEKIRLEKGEWKKGDFENTWFDVWLENFDISPDEAYCDEFFVYQLRSLDLLETDDFLNYQLQIHFGNNILKFKRFVSLSLRKHGEKLMLPDQVKTVEEWLSMIEAKPELSGTESNKPKGSKITREHGDNITCLNLVQTAYLVNLLRQSKIIIKDEKILPDSKAGEAFNVLTGYSENTLRLRMNLKGQSDVTYTDRKAVRNALYAIIPFIDKEIDEQKGKKPDSKT